MSFVVMDLAYFYKRLVRDFEESCKDFHRLVNTFRRIRDLRKHGVSITYK